MLVAYCISSATIQITLYHSSSLTMYIFMIYSFTKTVTENVLNNYRHNDQGYRGTGPVPNFLDSETSNRRSSNFWEPLTSSLQKFTDFRKNFQNVFMDIPQNFTRRSGCSHYFESTPVVPDKHLQSSPLK